MRSTGPHKQVPPAPSRNHIASVQVPFMERVLISRPCSGVLFTVPQPANAVTCFRGPCIASSGDHPSHLHYFAHFFAHNLKSTMLFFCVLPALLKLLEFYNHALLNHGMCMSFGYFGSVILVFFLFQIVQHSLSNVAMSFQHASILLVTHQLLLNRRC